MLERPLWSSTRTREKSTGRAIFGQQVDIWGQKRRRAKHFVNRMAARLGTRGLPSVERSSSTSTIFRRIRHCGRIPPTRNGNSKQFFGANTSVAISVLRH